MRKKAKNVCFMNRIKTLYCTDVKWNGTYFVDCFNPRSYEFYVNHQRPYALCMLVHPNSWKRLVSLATWRIWE